MTHFHSLKKINILNPILPSLVLFIFLICILTPPRGTILSSQDIIPWKAMEDVRPRFENEDVMNGCDLFSGDWVWDDKYPLYESADCGFLDEGFRCAQNGRPDGLYTKWRWQPKSCNLPKFDAKMMLENLRNQRLVFVGDSIGRNQWESLLCMLSSGVPDKSSIYEINGNPITNHMGFLAFKFNDFNCTVEYYRAPFLILQSRKPIKAPENVKTTLKLDVMDWSSNRWKDADIIVFNTGHWWNDEKTIRAGCYFQVGKDVKMEMSVESAYRKSMETVVDWLGRKVNLHKTHVVFRTYAPVHFSGGDWRNGGSCHLETLPDLRKSSPLSNETQIRFKIAVDQVSNHVHLPKHDLLNITHMTSRRKDAHLSLYYIGLEAGPMPLHRQDCSHWCLPGVPDSWNELLYALFLKRRRIYVQNLTKTL